MNIIETDYAWHGRLTERSQTTKLVLHHAAASRCTAEDIHRWHLANGWSGIGYHYLVRKDGSVYRGRPENTVGAHAYGANSVSVGVCFEGNFEEEVMPDAQFAAGAELIVDLMRRYSLGAGAVYGHRSISATACPGKNFPLEELKAAAAEKAAETEKARPEKENLVLSFQTAAVADGYSFPKYGTDGLWGEECESVASRCVVKKRAVYRNPNATKLVQRLLGVTADGKCGSNTDKAIRSYQKANGLSVDGAVGKQTWRRLLGVKP